LACIIEPVKLSAFILAGGKSSRMEKDKAFLELGGRTLLMRALELAGTVGEVYISGDAGKFAAYGRVVEDVYRDCGPLGAIHAALMSVTSDLNLMLAVDLPFIEPNFLEYLINRAQHSGAVVTVPRAGGGWQPLCAVYHRSFALVAERSLQEGRNKIDPLFSGVVIEVLGEGELLRHGFSSEMFRNLNTLDEWEAAKLRAPRA
jgi:molybdopterin-guanine dinucleotide biosynthesis protein A